jgi:hypothetical protein
MALSLTTSLNNTITKSELDTNFTSIQEKFNGGIDNSDIKAGAGIAVSKLAASKEYVTVNLMNPEYTWDATGSGPNTVIAAAGLPGLEANQADWALVKAKWFVQDTGSSAGTLDVALVEIDTNGDLQDVTVLVNEATMTVIADGKYNAGECTILASGAIEYHASNHYLLVLRQGATVGSGVLNAAGIIGVTLLLERDIQA